MCHAVISARPAILAALLFAAFIAGADSSPVLDHVPTREHARINPLAGRPEAVSAGALIYREHCEQCHKADAMGDGRKKPPLKSDHIRSATDGDLEWFLRQGDLRHGMPSWSGLPEAQRWQLVAFLRSVQ